MVKQKILKFSLPAILLAILATGIMVLAPVVSNNDPERVIASTNVTPRSNFLGEIFTFTIDIRYPRDKVIVEPGNIEVSFKPFTLVNTPTIKRNPGELVVSYKLRCLEETACTGNKSYPISDIIVYYIDKNTENVANIRIGVEPFYVSPQIDSNTMKLIIRYPNEPIVKENNGFFAGIFFGGILLIVFGLFGFRWLIFPAKKNTNSSGKDVSESNKNQFLERLRLLRLRNGNPRFIFAQSAGIIEDYLYAQDGEEISQDLREQLIALKRDSEDRAYQENDGNEPTEEEAALRIREISLILSQEEAGRS